jgi:protein SCO1/2
MSGPRQFGDALTTSGRVQLEKLVASCSATEQGPHDLVTLLDERSSLYEGRGASQVARMRGRVLAAFERVGTPHGALPFILEELENGVRPYLVAAAARALRGLSAPPPALVPLLLQAVRNIRYRDDAISFEHTGAGAFAGK